MTPPVDSSTARTGATTSPLMLLQCHAASGMSVFGNANVMLREGMTNKQRLRHLQVHAQTLSASKQLSKCTLWHIDDDAPHACMSMKHEAKWHTDHRQYLCSVERPDSGETSPL